MKIRTLLLLPLFTLILASCDSQISPVATDAFKGEYWMETTNIGVIDGVEEPLTAKSTWSPVSIYEKDGGLYVQTELLGAPDLGNEHPVEAEGTTERPNFIKPNRLQAEDSVPSSPAMDIFRIISGYIILESHGVMPVRTLPIKAKSGSAKVLNLEPYEPVEAAITGADGQVIVMIHAWYEYGPMVKNGETITWEVDYRDDYTPPSELGVNYDRIIHRNVLYKK